VISTPPEGFVPERLADATGPCAWRERSFAHRHSDGTHAVRPPRSLGLGRLEQETMRMGLERPVSFDEFVYRTQALAIAHDVEASDHPRDRFQLVGDHADIEVPLHGERLLGPDDPEPRSLELPDVLCEIG